jgi:subtilase family serine protease
VLSISKPKEASMHTPLNNTDFSYSFNNVTIIDGIENLFRRTGFNFISLAPLFMGGAPLRFQ